MCARMCVRAAGDVCDGIANYTISLHVRACNAITLNFGMAVVRWLVLTPDRVCAFWRAYVTHMDCAAECVFRVRVLYVAQE